MLKQRIFYLLLFVLIIIFLIVSLKYNVSNKAEGMRITIVSGSTNSNNGARTNMCYLIRTSKDKLIVVDGGDEYIDYIYLYDYIEKYGNGKVDYWYITHAHSDHAGALANC